MLSSLKQALSSIARLSSNEFVLHTDGRKVLLSDIVRETSFDLYQTQVHYEICRTLSERAGTDPTTRKVLENIYVLKSSQTRAASALVAYMSSTATPIACIGVNSSVRSLLPASVLTGVSLADWRGPASQYVAFGHVALLIAKSILHRVFRCFERKRQPGGTVVRGWVEVTAQMYPAEIQQGRLLIYPFALNVARQLRFILRCRRTGIDFSLAGQPYPLVRAFRMLFARVPHDMILAELEVIANQRHAEELLRERPQCLFTSDEFEAASFVLHDRLIAGGIRVVNTAHGVGNYCPHISYSEFRVLSDSQHAFYVKRNPSVQYTLLGSMPSRTMPLEPYRASLQKPAMLVLIHQPFEDSRLPAEAQAQRRLDVVLSEVARRLSIEYAIKMHPNHRSKQIGRAKAAFNGKPIYDWATLGAWRPIFVTINSTAFFDARGIAPVLVYAAPTFEPSLYFPQPFLTITVDAAEQTLRRLLSPLGWARAASLHADEVPTVFEQQEAVP